jgi:hypothetical protein
MEAAKIPCRRIAGKKAKVEGKGQGDRGAEQLPFGYKTETHLFHKGG